MKNKRAKKLARRIVRELFTSDDHDAANRLRLELANGRDGGSWTRKAARWQIYLMLRGRA